MDGGQTARGQHPSPQAAPAYLQPAPYWPTPPTSPPDELGDKGKDSETWQSVDAQTAFLGPSLWDAHKDHQLKYTDLEEFLNDTKASSQRRPAPPQAVSAGPRQGPPPPPPPALPDQRVWPPALTAPSQEGHPDHGMVPDHRQLDHYRSDEEAAAAGVKVKVEFQVSPSDLALATLPGMQFDPQTHQFSDEELKPQAMSKKSKKQVVPEERKDQRYWSRRQRNNSAAKRSRDARRLKENQIALRANFLEKENAALREVMDQLNRKNQELKAQVGTCQCR